MDRLALTVVRRNRGTDGYRSLIGSLISGSHSAPRKKELNLSAPFTRKKGLVCLPLRLPRQWLPPFRPGSGERVRVGSKDREHPALALLGVGRIAARVARASFCPSPQGSRTFSPLFEPIPFRAVAFGEYRQVRRCRRTGALPS